MKKRITLTKNDIYRGPLILVNKYYPISERFADQETILSPLTSNTEDIYLESRAAVMLSQLIKACGAESEIIPVSGYRTYKEQKKIFDESMIENGEAFTYKYVALPNCSEHQTGLAVDVAENKEEIDFICPEFPYHGICQLFRDKAMNFGFIERYPKGKESITGIGHEPWHFRYVGYPHAKMIKMHNLTLEEYTTMIKSYRFAENPYIFTEGKVRIEVSYVDLQGIDEQSIGTIGGMYQLSGNNVDGVVITVWSDKNGE